MDDRWFRLGDHGRYAIEILGKMKIASKRNPTAQKEFNMNTDSLLPQIRKKYIESITYSSPIVAMGKWIAIAFFGITIVGVLFGSIFSSPPLAAIGGLLVLGCSVFGRYYEWQKQRTLKQKLIAMDDAQLRSTYDDFIGAGGQPRPRGISVGAGLVLAIIVSSAGYLYTKGAAKLNIDLVGTEPRVNLAGNNQQKVTVKNNKSAYEEFQIVVQALNEQANVEGEWKKTFNIGPKETKTYTMDLPGHSVFKANQVRTIVKPVSK